MKTAAEPLTYSILKHNDGRMLAVVWPEKPELSQTCDLPCMGDCGNVCPFQRMIYSINSSSLARTWRLISENRKIFNQYEKACEQAIANAVPFKNKEDEIEIKRLIFDSIPPIEDVRSFSEWKMEPLKPYDVPENVKIIVMREVSIGKWNQFAFIKHEPKEEAESQDELWQEAIKLWLHSETLDELKYRFRIERIK